MKRKFRVIAFTLAILSCFGLFLFRHVYLLAYKSVPPLSIQQIQQAIQKAGGEKVIEKEASETLAHFGDDDSVKIFYDSDFTNCPAITNMASLLGGQVMGIWTAGADGIGVPAHVLIRRGSHFDYQFIYIFGTGSVPATNNLSIELISGTIYLRNTAP
jgi:hypothetical protein